MILKNKKYMATSPSTQYSQDEYNLDDAATLRSSWQPRARALYERGLHNDIDAVVAITEEFAESSDDEWRGLDRFDHLEHAPEYPDFDTLPWLGQTNMWPALKAANKDLVEPDITMSEWNMLWEALPYAPKWRYYAEAAFENERIKQWILDDNTSPMFRIIFSDRTPRGIARCRVLIRHLIRRRWARFGIWNETWGIGDHTDDPRHRRPSIQPEESFADRVDYWRWEWEGLSFAPHMVPFRNKHGQLRVSLVSRNKGHPVVKMLEERQSLGYGKLAPIKRQPVPGPEAPFVARLQWLMERPWMHFETDKCAEETRVLRVVRARKNIYFPAYATSKSVKEEWVKAGQWDEKWTERSLIGWFWPGEEGEDEVFDLNTLDFATMPWDDREAYEFRKLGLTDVFSVTERWRMQNGIPPPKSFPFRYGFNENTIYPEENSEQYKGDELSMQMLNSRRLTTIKPKAPGSPVDIPQEGTDEFYAFNHRRNSDLYIPAIHPEWRAYRADRGPVDENAEYHNLWVTLREKPRPWEVETRKVLVDASDVENPVFKNVKVDGRVYNLTDPTNKAARSLIEKFPAVDPRTLDTGFDYIDDDEDYDDEDETDTEMPDAPRPQTGITSDFRQLTTSDDDDDTIVPDTPNLKGCTGSNETRGKFAGERPPTTTHLGNYPTPPGSDIDPGPTALPTPPLSIPSTASPPVVPMASPSPPPPPPPPPPPSPPRPPQSNTSSGDSQDSKSDGKSGRKAKESGGDDDSDGDSDDSDDSSLSSLGSRTPSLPSPAIRQESPSPESYFANEGPRSQAPPSAPSSSESGSSSSSTNSDGTGCYRPPVYRRRSRSDDDEDERPNKRARTDRPRRAAAIRGIANRRRACGIPPQGRAPPATAPAQNRQEHKAAPAPTADNDSRFVKPVGRILRVTKKAGPNDAVKVSKDGVQKRVQKKKTPSNVKTMTFAEIRKTIPSPNVIIKEGDFNTWTILTIPGGEESVRTAPPTDESRGIFNQLPTPGVPFAHPNSANETFRLPKADIPSDPISHRIEMALEVCSKKTVKAIKRALWEEKVSKRIAETGEKTKSAKTKEADKAKISSRKANSLVSKAGVTKSSPGLAARALNTLWGIAGKL